MPSPTAYMPTCAYSCSYQSRMLSRRADGDGFGVAAFVNPLAMEAALLGVDLTVAVDHRQGVAGPGDRFGAATAELLYPVGVEVTFFGVEGTAPGEHPRRLLRSPVSGSLPNDNKSVTLPTARPLLRPRKNCAICIL
jgi:hypothetical protein